jgi:molybdopterin molybdotransferase
VKQGAVMLAAGCRLRPQDAASAAAAGHAALSCYQRPRVAIFSTGDEIIRPGETAKAGQVYDANAPMLKGLIEAAGAESIDLGVLPDKAEAVQASLKDAAGKYDVLITTGGASRGEEDHVVDAVDTLGTLHMWQIAVKPGRPMLFGQIGDCVVMGLPGNPVAVFVCFLLYVRPVLVRLGGGAWPEPARYPLQAAFAVPKKKTGRREFWRGFLTQGQNGMLAAGKFERDGSGLITGLREADGLIEVSEDVTQVSEGDMVSFIPFTEFGIRRA